MPNHKRTLFQLSHAPTYVTLISLAVCGVSQKAYSQSNTLVEDQPLRDGQYLRSKNGAFIALMQNDGNFVIYRGTSPTDEHGHLWAHDKNSGRCSCFAVIQGDGNFVVYYGTSMNDRHGVIWGANNNKAGYSGPYVGILQDDGNFVVYHGHSDDDRQGVQWATNQTDPVQSYDNISTFNYDLGKSHIKKISSVTIYSQGVSNDTDLPQTSSISGGGQTTESSNWSDTITNTFGVKSSSEFKIPIIGGIKETVDLSYQYENAKMNGGSSSATTQWQFTAALTLNPHTKGTVTELASTAEITVPYTLTGTAVFQSGARMPTTLNGVYTGTNAFNAQVVLEGESHGANGSPNPFKLVLLQGTKPMLAGKRSPAVVNLAPAPSISPPPTSVSPPPSTIHLPPRLQKSQ